ncbi:amino acid permease [Macrococcus animalis]|uniref:amino acid permease n=1 Tax=Macrococcus animalis TaxID=3395467 RepID=UPI0039BECF05
MDNRHIQLIAIGGAIGTGLFLGAGKSISLAGPSLLLAYIIIGLFLFLMMRAMGEILLSDLRYNSFTDFANHYLGDFVGFLTGWTYWFCWVMTGIADVTAVTKYINFWWPDIPAWFTAIVTVLLLILLNMFTAKIFGELEFWFALIKVIAIIALIIIGSYLILTHFKSPSGSVASLNNLTDHGGFFPKGLNGFLLAFQMAVFSFVGIELVGVAAKETKNPTKTLPKAINSIGIRILIFYVISLLIIMCITPWNQINPAESPFVSLFTLAGIPAAAGIVNFVVLTSAASAGNSGVYSNSRMVYGLSKQNYAPQAFEKTNKRGVPQNALLFSGVVMFFAAILNFVIEDVFTFVTSVATICFIFIWSVIMISYIKYRKVNPELHVKSVFKMPLGVLGCYVTLIFFAILLGLLTLAQDTRIALVLTPIWFIMLTVCYFIFVKRKSIN